MTLTRRTFLSALAAAAALPAALWNARKPRPFEDDLPSYGIGSPESPFDFGEYRDELERVLRDYRRRNRAFLSETSAMTEVLKS